VPSREPRSGFFGGSSASELPTVAGWGSLAGIVSSAVATRGGAPAQNVPAIEATAGTPVIISARVNSCSAYERCPRLPAITAIASSSLAGALFSVSASAVTFARASCGIGRSEARRFKVGFAGRVRGRQARDSAQTCRGTTVTT